MSQSCTTEQSSGIFARFGTKYGVDGSTISTILKATAFKVKDSVVSDEQMAALLIVADQFNLNPFTKEIYAFPDKQNGIVPVIGVDGWARTANEHPQFDGCEFRYAENIVKIDKNAKDCPEWVECVMYRKDRARPTIVREYTEECYQPPREGKYGSFNGPWQSHTRRFMRHKAFMQAARLALGFSGIYDEDEAQRIAEARVIEAQATLAPSVDITPPALPPAQQFEQMALEMGLPREACEIYLQTWANHSKITVDVARSTALKDPQNFQKCFTGWENSRQAQLASAQKTPIPTETIDSETGEVTGVSEEKNLLSQSKTQSPRKRNTPETIACPNTRGTSVPASKCDKCIERPGCPAHDEKSQETDSPAS